MASECGDIWAGNRVAIKGLEPRPGSRFLEPKATGSLAQRPAKRSGIGPFIVMDVMREANAKAASGDMIHTWKWASRRRARLAAGSNGNARSRAPYRLLAQAPSVVTSRSYRLHHPRRGGEASSPAGGSPPVDRSMMRGSLGNAGFGSRRGVCFGSDARGSSPRSRGVEPFC